MRLNGAQLVVEMLKVYRVRHVFGAPDDAGLAIFATVLSFNLLGDGLRDALDPYLK